MFNTKERLPPKTKTKMKDNAKENGRVNGRAREIDRNVFLHFWNFFSHSSPSGPIYHLNSWQLLGPSVWRFEIYLCEPNPEFRQFRGEIVVIFAPSPRPIGFSGPRKCALWLARPAEEGSNRLFPRKKNELERDGRPETEPTAESSLINN